MSFQSPEDNTIRVEFTPGQPRGAVAGQSGITPHRIDISRKDGQTGADNTQYFPGSVPSHFILRKNRDNTGYSETPVDAGVQPDGDGQRLTDHTISILTQAVKLLEDLLLCPVDVEFAIDRQGRLFLLQVRPITRLSGGMDFAMPIPEETLASGEGVSEGYCTGPLWLANQQTADTMPEGAIVVALHPEVWMLEPEFLKRAGGFVVAAGGFNDHVGILMRQIKMPLMVAGDLYPAVAGDLYPAVAAQVGQQATLACARFNGEPGAFIVTGDLTEKLASHGSLSSAFSDVPLARAIPSWDDLSLPDGAFCQVASGFQWLTDQNARLLALFAPGGGLDCLANPVTLSMSPQRAKRVAEMKYSVNRLVHGAEALLDGYQAFLLLPGNSRSDKVQPFLDELPQLITRFKTLKQTITSGLESIILPLQAGEELQLSEGMFHQWMAACHQLQSSLQALHPAEAKQVRSVHDLIFALHQRFVKALAPVTLDSGQGGKLSTKKDITYVDCTTPGEKAPLLTPSVKASIEQSKCQVAVVSMDDALIVNLFLGTHVGMIELLEHAEGGKGRTLRLKFSDRFKRPDGSDEPGKLKRMWFLVQLLKAIELDKNADSMKLSCNAVAGEITVECPQMRSPKTMQHAFENLMTVLDAIKDLDVHFQDLPIFEGNQWNFNLLAQRLNNDFSAGADRFALQHCLFSMFYKGGYKITPGCCQLLSNHHQQFIHYAQRLADCQKKPEGYVREILMSDEIAKDTRRKLLHHLLLIATKYATPPVELEYDFLRDQYFVINPSPTSYNLEFYIPPGQPLPDNKEKVKHVLLEHGLKYASQQVRNDKDVVLPTIKEHPKDLKYVSKALKDDKDVVIAAVTQNGEELEYASPALKDNHEVVKAAVTEFPRALRFASETVRSDKNIVNMIIEQEIGYLHFASKTVLNDREYMLELIKDNHRAFIFAAQELKNDYAFIHSAILRNHKVIKYLRK